MERDPSLDDRFDPAVRMVAYDPGWVLDAASELVRITAALRGDAIGAEHVGSTAVPGLVAKPIIDLQVSVVNVDRFDVCIAALTVIGYTYVPDPASPTYRLLVQPAARPRSHHLHLCLGGGVDERRHLAVRDYLRANRLERNAYGARKSAVAATHPEDRLAYIAGKSAYVDALEARALRWASARS